MPRPFRPSAPLLAALLLAAGCAHAGEGDPPANFPAPPHTTQTPTGIRYPVPPASVDVPDASDGVFRLTEVGGRRLPAADGSGSCAPQVVNGTLSLGDNRFSLSVTTQPTCGANRTPTVQRAEGRVAVNVSTATFSADSASSFQSATGVFLGTSEVQIVEVTSGGTARRVGWRFVRQRMGGS